MACKHDRTAVIGVEYRENIRFVQLECLNTNCGKIFWRRSE